MGRNIIDIISSKIELFRLEQRYTKRRHRRSTFISEAQYVDGEYVYNNSSPTKRHSVAQFPSHSTESMSTEEGTSPTRSQHSNMPGYGNNPCDRNENDYRREQATEREGQFGSIGELGKHHTDKTGQSEQRKSRWGSVSRLGKRRSMVTVQEVRWEDQHYSPSSDRVHRDY